MTSVGKKIDLKLIRTDGGTQTRAGLDQNTVQEYADAMGNGDTFPDCIVFYDGSVYWLADGFHRHAAAKLAKKRTLSCEVRQGDQRQAVLFSVGANATHGLRRSNADKRRAVEVLLRDPEWTAWSDREIARRCGVDNKTVARIREELTEELPQSDKRIGGDGREISTTNIGKKPKTSEWLKFLDNDKFYVVNWKHKIVYGTPVTYDGDKYSIVISYLHPDTSLRAVSTLATHYGWEYQAEIPSEIYADRRERALLWANHQYLVNHEDKLIYKDAIPKGQDDEAKLSDPRYAKLLAQDKLTLEDGAELQRLGVRFDGYRVVEPPALEQEQFGEEAPVSPEQSLQLQREYRYKPGQAARCHKCGQQYHTPAHLEHPDTIYTNWTMPSEPGMWVCPKGHRTPDGLMRIIGEQIGEETSVPPVAAVIVPEKFGVLLVDGPWKYDNDDDSHYGRMTAAEIAALPVESLAADDCALFLWTTFPMLFKADDVAAAWGFEYTGSAFTWAKVKKGLDAGTMARLNDDSAWHMGNGSYMRANSEICLLFRRGMPKRRNGDVRQLIVASVREHSRKPDEQYGRIERMYAGPYLELFARQKREGWFAWGNEIASDISFGGIAAAVQR